MAKRKPLVYMAGEIVESKISDTIEGNNIIVTATGSTAERTLKERFNDIINVKDYGAKGNGITDDTAAFQAAVSIAEQKNSVIYVPYGVYNISEPVEGEFISFGHPIITGNGSVTFLLDLYDDLVHKTKNVNETITGNKTFTGKTTFSGSTVNNGNESHSGTETHTGSETHKGTETHEGNETHGKASGTTLTYHGTETHDGPETHSGNETHAGTEVHNGPVTFNDDVNLSNKATAALTENLLATENNGFVNPTTLNGKLRIDPNEFIAANGGLSISSANNINKLKVDLSNANKALLGNITPNIIKNNSGLSIDPATNKLKVDFQDITIDQLTPLVDPNGGIVVNNDQTDTNGYGKLKINFQDLTVDQITPLCDPEGGIVVNEDQDTIGYGKLKIDFSTMKMDKFMELMDQLNLPYFIGETISGQTIPATFYVNPITGKNIEKEIETIDDDETVTHFYGWSEEYPWKTIKYAIQILSAKYNISTKAVKIKVHATNGYEFTDSLECAQYTKTTGSITICPATANDKIIIHIKSGAGSNCLSHTGGTWIFNNVVFKRTFLPQTKGSQQYPNLIVSSSGSDYLTLNNCNYEFIDKSLMKNTPIQNLTAGGFSLHAIESAGGHIKISGNNDTILNQPKRLIKDIPTPRFSILKKNSLLKAGSIFNGSTLTEDITLPSDQTIRRKTILVKDSVIKGGYSSSLDSTTGVTTITPSGSTLLTGSLLNNSTIAQILTTQYTALTDENVVVTNNGLLTNDVTIEDGLTGIIQEIDLTPFEENNQIDPATHKVNYRSQFKGYERNCIFAKDTIIKAGSSYNSYENIANDVTLTKNTQITSFNLVAGSVIAAGSFLIPTTINDTVTPNVSYGPIINTKNVSNDSNDISIGWTTEDIPITTTTTFTGSDAVSTTWFYVYAGGLIQFANSSVDSDGYSYANIAYYVEGRFSLFYSIYDQGHITQNGTGQTHYFLYDPFKVSGNKYQITRNGNIVIPSIDYVDRDTEVPGGPSATKEINSQTGAWISPVDPD